MDELFVDEDEEDEEEEEDEESVYDAELAKFKGDGKLFPLEAALK